ncbi:transglycosylase domain-containing protein [Fusobacterium sp.]|uniref:transglycosylase domain-containing protein n=1 Tax=Fusobacterium sp. TaxID=68766 RepID=UPI00263927BC|nr:transglycosylase domain-containing protein [Fusobacterium sp.]
MKKIFKVTLLVGLILSLTGILSIFLVINHYKKEMPDIENLIESYTPSVPTKVYDINGKVIDILYKESRIPVQFDEVPQSVKDAFISIEDRRFYSHYGIDPIGILRAIAINLKYHSRRQGASTFTQQLARNAFLTHEKKISRKIKEAILTIEIEKTYTKDEIFVKYLNEIYFGDGDYGIKSAAKSLFKKDVRYLNLPESAMLAGIPNRPGFYNPRKGLDNAIKRMNIILKQMYSFDMITKEEYDEAVNHKFVLEENYKEGMDLAHTTIIYPRTRANKSLAPSFTDLVLDYLQNNFDDEVIYNGGLQVYTTLNYDMQQVAEKIFKEFPPLVKNRELQGAMITMNTSNGYITSIIGGKDYTSGNFNRAVMAKRQIGSSFKPFVYLSAIMDGYSENTIVEDSRSLYDQTWAPKNYGVTYRNNTTLLDGLVRSVNSVAVKLLKNVGPQKLADNLKKLNADLDPGLNLSSALGTISATPKNLAKGFAIFSNGGYVVEPMIIVEIRDYNGNTLIKNVPSVEKVFEPKDIALTTNLLIGSVRYGTSKGATVITKKGKTIEQGGKTGTTNDALSVWYAGITPDYVTTAYIGYDDNKKMQTTGGELVAPLWKRYYEELINKGLYTPSKFEFIDTLVASGELYYQNLDPYSGLISTSGNAKRFLLRDNRVELEKNEKYKKDLIEILYN